MFKKCTPWRPKCEIGLSPSNPWWKVSLSTMHQTSKNITRLVSHLCGRDSVGNLPTLFYDRFSSWIHRTENYRFCQTPKMGLGFTYSSIFLPIWAHFVETVFFSFSLRQPQTLLIWQVDAVLTLRRVSNRDANLTTVTKSESSIEPENYIEFYFQLSVVI